MAIFLAILFVVALCGLFLSLSSSEETAESQFRVFFLPGGGTFEYNLATGEAIIRGGTPEEYGWHRVHPESTVWFKRYEYCPDTVAVQDNGDTVVLDISGDKAVELSRESWF